MKGIILAGGFGTRLYPATSVISKQLLPVCDKPMIYYPLCTLFFAGIRDILIVTTPEGLPLFKELLKDGTQWGVSIQYAVQDKPRGIAEAFIIGEKFIGNDPVCLILGDNIVHSDKLVKKLETPAKLTQGAHIFAYHVHDPERYGILELDADNKPIRIIEKPKNPPSQWATIGIYFYDNQVCDVAKSLSPSARGELEITDVSNWYLENGSLEMTQLGRGVAWLDTGTPESLIEASNFISILERRQGVKIGSPEEAAWFKGFITDSELEMLAEHIPSASYRQYLLGLLYS